jgi:hypothetical protein
MRCHSVGSGDGDPNAISNAVGYAQHYSRSHNAVIRVYDDAGNVIETHEHKGDFKRPRSIALISLRSLPRSEDELRDLITAVRV